MNRSKLKMLLLCMIVLSSAHVEAGFISHVWGKVKQQFVEHPVMTGCIASGIVGAAVACCNRFVGCRGHQPSAPVVVVPPCPVVDQPQSPQVSEKPAHVHGIVTAILEHPRAAACTAGLLLAALGYVEFTRLRDREINAQLDTKINDHFNDCKELMNVTREYHDTISAYGKSCNFTTTITVNCSVGHIRVKRDSDNEIIIVKDLEK